MLQYELLFMHFFQTIFHCFLPYGQSPSFCRLTCDGRYVRSYGRIGILVTSRLAQNLLCNQHDVKNALAPLSVNDFCQIQVRRPLKGDMPCRRSVNSATIPAYSILHGVIVGIREVPHFRSHILMLQRLSRYSTCPKFKSRVLFIHLTLTTETPQ